MILESSFNARVLSKFATQKGDNTYFNLFVQLPSGHGGEVSCTAEVFNSVLENKEYSLIYNLNTAYLGKNYSCMVRVSDFGEPVCVSKKGGK